MASVFDELSSNYTQNDERIFEVVTASDAVFTLVDCEARSIFYEQPDAYTYVGLRPRYSRHKN